VGLPTRLVRNALHRPPENINHQPKTLANPLSLPQKLPSQHVPPMTSFEAVFMSHYFFDLVREGASQYDYRGRLFADPDKALRLAELMAMDLAIEADESWLGWSIKVCNAKGLHLFSVPVVANT
jgi:hypothetical protein